MLYDSVGPPVTMICRCLSLCQFSGPECTAPARFLYCHHSANTLLSHSRQRLLLNVSTFNTNHCSQIKEDTGKPSVGSRMEEVSTSFHRPEPMLAPNQCHLTITVYVNTLTQTSTCYTVGTCESFFSFESNLESNQPYTTQAVTQPNGLQAYCTACYRPIIC